MCVHKRMYELIYAHALDRFSANLLLVGIGPGFGLWWERTEPSEARQDKTRQYKTRHN